MKKRIMSLFATCFLFCCFCVTSVNATELTAEYERKQIDINEMEFADEVISADTSQETIDISEMLNQRAQTIFDNDPRTGITNTLSVDNIYDVALFSITSPKNMVLRFVSDNAG